MSAQTILEKTGESLSARRVFSEPIDREGVTVVLAASVRGGAGRGEGSAADGAEGRGRGVGEGLGIVARPVGAYVIREGKVRWRPAIDVNRVILGGQLVALGGLFVARILLRQSARREIGRGLMLLNRRAQLKRLMRRAAKRAHLA